MEYNPNSTDSQFASIHTTLGSQNVMLFQILEETRRTNGRVTALEKDVVELDKKLESKWAILDKQMEGRWKYLTGGAAAVALFGGGAYAFLHYLMS